MVLGCYYFVIMLVVKAHGGTLPLTHANHGSRSQLNFFACLGEAHGSTLPLIHADHGPNPQFTEDFALFDFRCNLSRPTGGTLPLTHANHGPSIESAWFVLFLCANLSWKALRKGLN